MTKSNHPVSIYSKIHSSNEKTFIPANNVTFDAMERAKAMFGKATFVMDWGYEDNKMFLKLDELKQDYLIRLTAKKKHFFHNKWIAATELRNRRKGKKREADLSHVKVQITAAREDVIRIARLYFSSWPIEEYLRCKKQVFWFENFRVRKINLRQS